MAFATRSTRGSSEPSMTQHRRPATPQAAHLKTDQEIRAHARTVHASAIVIDANDVLALGQVPFDRVTPDQSCADDQRSRLTALSYNAGRWGPGAQLSDENDLSDLPCWHGL